MEPELRNEKEGTPSLRSLTGQIEAILYAVGDPIPLTRLAELLKIDRFTLDGLLRELQKTLEEDSSRGLTLHFLEDKVQFSTKACYGEAVLDALEARKAPTLSPSALEVLSIAAYRQPVTRSVIEQIRGVDSAYTLSSLLDKGILEECGRLDVPGRPILYRTTDAFLRIFGLDSLRDLPPLPDEVAEHQLTILGSTEEDTGTAGGEDL